ncbi:MAG: efflux RND transporter permease subunit [candidate division Zixibacteria bacterium]|nr:efflux RND transporter permease subunit [candidate division Zixibacteria bacterium]
MFLSDLSIRRPVMISMVLAALLLFGVLAYMGLSLQLFPDVDFPAVTVETVYPGAGPKEMETQITKPIEDAISTISRIDEIQSFSMDGFSFVVIIFELGKDVDIANQEVKDKVDAILNDLPDESNRPIIQKFDIGDVSVVDLVLSGDLEMTELYEIGDKRLKDRFSQVEGVAQVDLSGGQEREIRVELDNRTVFQNSISLSQLSQILGAQNLDMPGGQFQQRSQEYSVRLKGEFEDIQAIEELEIPTAYGTKKIADIATVRDLGAEVRERTSFFDNIEKTGSDNVVLLSLYKTAEGNTVKIAEAVRKTLPQINSELPAGCKLTLATDNSIFTQATVDDTLTNVILGVILTALVMLLFLHDARSTIIVALSMPMSILSTFLLLQVSGYTLNLMTLMGLSTAVGILVVNSVVVLENIFRHKQMGGGSKESASTGTAEVVAAVIAATLTNVVVFLPLANMGGIVGVILKEFALTVVYATMFSLLMSFTLTPMMASLILPESSKKGNSIAKKLESVFRSWEIGYQKLLAAIFEKKRRGILVIAGSFLLLLLSLGVASTIGFEFMSEMDEGDIQIEVELPLGYRLDETAQVTGEIERRLKGHQEVKHIIITVGKLSATDQGTNLALIKVKLIDAGARERSTHQMANLFVKELSDIPNAQIRAAAMSSAGPGGFPVEFDLLGQDTDTLEVYKDGILSRIKDIDGLVNVNTSSRPGKPEIAVKPDRKKLVDAGLTVFDLATALRSAVEGVVTTRHRDRGEEYDMRVMMEDESVDSPEKVGNITVVAPTGTYRLSQLTDIEFSEGYSKILHKDRYKWIAFKGGVAPGYVLGDIRSEIDRRVEDLRLPSGYRLSWSGDVEMMEETTADMLTTFLLALILTYMLLAAILESLTQPLIILGTVPLALIGVFWGLALTGLSMNTISMMAIVMLLGIVVNNAILLLDYTNLLVRKQGKDVKTALLEACPTKLKPIIMSSTAIILGMLPMASGLGAAGSEIRQPMGVVAIGGLIVSTVLALLVIPVLYNLTVKAKRR